MFHSLLFINRWNSREKSDARSFLGCFHKYYYGYSSIKIKNIFKKRKDVAVDGWALSIMNQENLAYGALAQTIGLTFGIILSFNVFIPLNSIEFCNQYIFSSPRQVKNFMLSN